ncbi:hypothetical protein [Pantoea agglomerans]|uniref:hypothetical protein n=1 Tax=Enterobacter agglomerans TaxID=549 RepID=UPI003C7A4F1C
MLGFGCRFEEMGVVFEVLEAGRENGWLVAGGWWLVAGGELLVASCWWRVAGGELLVAVSREPPKGLLCPIAKDSRIRADRPRHPWRGRFVLRPQQAFLVGIWVSL